MTDETITFYHAAPSRGSIVHWMLEEVGAPFRTELLDLSKGEQKRPEYRAGSANSDRSIGGVSA